MIYIARDLSGVIGTAQVDTKKPLGRGATAIVYPAELNGSSFAAKIYHSDKKLDIVKIEAMLANPPANVRIQFAGAQHSQLAWPSAILTPPAGRDLGYLMPLSDLSKSFSLDHYYDQTLLRKLKSPSEGALSFKLEIARNLCLLVADLHDHNHCFIDMKPQNIRVLLGSHVVTLLDCDGFSIAGADGKRYPAELLSSDYISPEAYQNKTLPSQLGEDQDRYALAVILFQLLNGGTHPFQGIINGSGITAATNDEKAAQGLYPHGVKPDPRITPRPQSIHFLLDDGMQALFNAAFIGRGNQRPSARDWAHLLDTLLRSKALTRCDKETFDLGHMRFKDKPCPACYLAGLKTVVVAKTNVKLPPILPPIPPSMPSAAPTRTAPYQQTPPRPSAFSDWGFLGIMVLLLLFAVWAGNQSSPPQEIPVGVPNTTSVPQPASPNESGPQNPQRTFTTITYANGDKYVGEVKDGKADGQGTFTSANGDKYLGEFKDDKLHGQGTFTSTNGDKYVGAFKNGKANGEGTYTFANGTPSSKGIWADGTFVQSQPAAVQPQSQNPTTTLTFANGDKYVGEYKDGKFNGQGTLTSASGNKYVGAFKDGKADGQGTLTSASGDKYVGAFKDDKLHGQGTFTFASGNKYIGEYKDDKLHGQGTYTWANGDKYVGEFKDDKRNGMGIFTSANGDKYVGGYKDGKMHGQGTITFADESPALNGIWADDALVQKN